MFLSNLTVLCFSIVNIDTTIVVRKSYRCLFVDFLTVFINIVSIEEEVCSPGLCHIVLL